MDSSSYLCADHSPRWKAPGSMRTTCPRIGAPVPSVTAREVDRVESTWGYKPGKGVLCPVYGPFTT